MEQPVLIDKTQFPTNNIIFSHIGKAKALWEELFEYIQRTYPGYTQEWRYYNDGKSWLLKIVKKKKTICWVSIVKDGFRMSLYFTDKVENIINESAILPDLKKQFADAKRFNKIRGLVITFKNKKDLEAARVLLAIKDSIK